MSFDVFNAVSDEIVSKYQGIMTFSPGPGLSGEGDPPGGGLVVGQINSESVRGKDAPNVECQYALRQCCRKMKFDYLFTSKQPDKNNDV